jgi:hypothetical protein
MNDLGSLQMVIRQLHGCESAHVQSVDVVETVHGATVWDGVVEVFDLIGHPTARRCYAWNYTQDGGGTRYMAVLELPPVDSPRRAVQAAIAADRRK